MQLPFSKIGSKESKDQNQLLDYGHNEKPSVLVQREEIY